MTAFLFTIDSGLANTILVVVVIVIIVAEKQSK